MEDWNVWEERILEYGRVNFGSGADLAIKEKIIEAEDKDGKF